MATRKAARKRKSSPSTPAPRRSARAALLRWYDAHRRDLPWRATRDPYAIWVSEIMLQQTRVETVVRYYDRFLARFPTPAALAHATEDQVLSAWSGLGYYRRARLLHQGAREVVARHDGRVPEDPDARRGLPGVGRYTAGAIGSIAFDREEPIVDGNVARVLSRMHGIATPLGRADTERALWLHAQRWVLGGRPGALNQALMELGATVCVPKQPRCEACPWRSACHARRHGRIDVLPVPRVKGAPRKVQWVALWVQPQPGHVCLTRGAQALFGGLWNLPMHEGAGREHALELLRSYGLTGGLSAQPMATVQHVLTHRHMHVELWRVMAAHARVSDRWRVVNAAELGQLGVSRLTLKLLAAGEFSLER